MCEGDGRERDRALVSTAERYLGSSQERPALLQDGFRAAVRLWRHYEGVVKAGCAEAEPGTDGGADMGTISRLEDEVRVLKLRLTEARAAFERLKCSRNDWAGTERDGLVVRNKSLEAELAELRKGPGVDDRSDMLEAVAAASLELSRALSAFGDEESLLAAIRGITSGSRLFITFCVFRSDRRLDVCVHARSGMEDSEKINRSANPSEVTEVLLRLEREVLEGVAEEEAAGGSSELEDALEEEEQAEREHFDPRRGLKTHEGPAAG